MTSAQTSSQPFRLSDRDRAWLSDSVQAEVTRKLVEGKQCMENLFDCEKRIVAKDELLQVRFDRMMVAETKFGTCIEQKTILQGIVKEQVEKINRRDQKITGLQVKQGFVIGGFGIVTVGLAVALIYVVTQ